VLVIEPSLELVLGRRPFATADEMDKYIEEKLDDEKQQEKGSA
jgi:hypothetical protein